jgi:hypothetical protein
MASKVLSDEARDRALCRIRKRAYIGPYIIKKEDGIAAKLIAVNPSIYWSRRDESNFLHSHYEDSNCQLGVYCAQRNRRGLGINCDFSLLENPRLYALMVNPQQLQRSSCVMLFSGRARLMALYLSHNAHGYL